MTKEELYKTLVQKFAEVLQQYQIEDAAVKITCRSLSSEEAIGTTDRKDFPVITGKDVMIQAEYNNCFGQAFTDSPSSYSGSLRGILKMDLVNNPHERSIFIATLNAVMKSLGLCDGTVHCRSDGPEKCALKMSDYLHLNYPAVKKIALIGYQPALLEMLSKAGYSVRVLDLNKDNIGQVRYGICVEDGSIAKHDAVENFADLVLCTGSTLCNGTIVDYLEVSKPVLFFGITIAGSAGFLGVKRVCFAAGLSL